MSATLSTHVFHVRQALVGRVPNSYNKHELTETERIDKKVDKRKLNSEKDVTLSSDNTKEYLICTLVVIERSKVTCKILYVHIYYRSKILNFPALFKDNRYVILSSKITSCQLTLIFRITHRILKHNLEVEHKLNFVNSTFNIYFLTSDTSLSLVKRDYARSRVPLPTLFYAPINLRWCSVWLSV